MALGQLVRPNSYKIAVLGEGGIGKTTICKTYDHQKSYMNTVQTIAVEFHVVRRVFRGENYTLQIWDLGGQTHFKNMGVFEKYCKGIHGALVCFDLTDIETLFSLPEWLAFIPEGIPRFLIGTKADLADSDDFVQEEIQRLMEEHGFIDYIATSATDVESIEKVFNCLLAKLTAPVTPSVSLAELFASKNLESM